MTELSREMTTPFQVEFSPLAKEDFIAYADGLQAGEAGVAANAWIEQEEAEAKNETLRLLGHVGLHGGEAMKITYSTFADVEILGHDQRHDAVLAKGIDGVYVVSHRVIGLEVGDHIQPRAHALFLHEQARPCISVKPTSDVAMASVTDAQLTGWRFIRQEIVEVTEAARTDRIISAVLPLFSADVVQPLLYANGDVDSWRLGAEQTVVLDGESAVTLSVVYERAQEASHGLQLRNVGLILKQAGVIKERYNIRANTLELTHGRHDTYSGTGNLHLHTRAERVVQKVLAVSKQRS